MLEKIGTKAMFVCGVTILVLGTVGFGWVIINGIKQDIDDRKEEKRLKK